MAKKKKRKVKRKVKLLAGAIGALLLGVFLLVIAIEAKEQQLEDIVQQVQEEKEDTLFLELSSEGNELGSYREEVSKRLQQENFFTDKEVEKLQDSGYTVSRETASVQEYLENINSHLNLFYPVLYQEDESYYLIYATGTGKVFKKDISQKELMGEEIGNLHTSDFILRATEGYSVAYNDAEGTVRKYSLGEIQEECNVPEKSIYAGFSYREGYVFRDKDKVYTVNPEVEEVNLIAEDVQCVIIADYYENDVYWAQPLLKMEDGSIKVYTNELETSTRPGR